MKTMFNKQRWKYLGFFAQSAAQIKFYYFYAIAMKECKLRRKHDFWRSKPILLSFLSFERLCFATSLRCDAFLDENKKTIVHSGIADDNAIIEECFDWKIAQKENWKQQWRNNRTMSIANKLSSSRDDNRW